VTTRLTVSCQIWCFIVNVKILNELSLLGSTLSKQYSLYLKSACKTVVSKYYHDIIMNIYSAHCYSLGHRNYTALDVLSNSGSFNTHFQLLIGFIYDCNNLSLDYRYLLCNYTKKLFCYIAQDKQLNLDEIEVSPSKITTDVWYCIELYCQQDKDQAKLDYINGWQVVSKEGTASEVRLDSLYVNFGVEFTNKVHLALINYGLTQNTTTLRGRLGRFKQLFIGMTTVCNKTDGLTINTLLSCNHVQSFFYKIYIVLFARSQASQYCPKSFHTNWASMVSIYTECFINTNIFDSPLKPFIVPHWKAPKDTAPIFSIGGDTTKDEDIRWFADIPLKIKDAEAIAVIQKRVDRDMAHIRHICLLKFKELQEREGRNKTLINSGEVKPLDAPRGRNKYNFFVGIDKLENTVATFWAHGIGAKPFYARFLGFKDSKYLNTELNLPTFSTLNVLFTLLVMEHPLITPSWLEKWELFDTHDNKTGYKQVGNQYVAVSSKSRKGITYAQQPVILNDLSKTIVEFLEQHTHKAREHLKKKGDVNWRKMVLTATNSTSLFSTKLPTPLKTAVDFYSWLQDESLFDKASDITLTDAQTISKIHTLRSIRRHRALQIYLKTRSMDAVAEALGHEKTIPDLLTVYLPKPLMDFFNERWIRQFQNAILLEAMKNSVYRLDAVNMSTQDIEEFLKNHGISNIPQHFIHGFNQQVAVDNGTSEPLAFDQLTYTISTALLQLLMAIRFVVEDSDNKASFFDVVSHWYQSAVFILDTLSSGRYSSDDKLMEMLKIATNNKLDSESIKGALLC